jgi:glutathione S-transferase
MTTPLVQHSWRMSPYSAKTRAYLRVKGIPFVERAPSLWALRRTIHRAVGAAIMPTIQRDDGSWLQDSAVILDTLEAEYPTPHLVPIGPRQRVATELLALYADEWLVMAALHYRWNRPKNTAFALQEFGRYGLPGVPGPLRRRVALKIAQQMRAYRPKLGITDATHAGIESATEALIAHLQVHLDTHDYLLGGRPSVGDFALYGQLWAHLWRDPDTTSLFDQAPAVRRWMQCLTEPTGRLGPYLADDAVPATLTPLLALAFADQWPHLVNVQAAIDTWRAEHPDAQRLPRSLGTTTFHIGECYDTRRMLTFAAWKAQRVLDHQDAPGVSAWLTSIGGDVVRTFTAGPRQVRQGHRLVLMP